MADVLVLMKVSLPSKGLWREEYPVQGAFACLPSPRDPPQEWREIGPPRDR